MNIEEKINSLEKRTHTISILSGLIEQFIDAKVEIKPTLIRPGFYLDSISLYKAAINFVTDSDSTIGIVADLMLFISILFGCECTEESRWKVIDSGDVDEDGFIDGVSIIKFIGKNAALCLERASFLHNCLMILDICDIMKVGNIIFDDEDSPHAYNLVTTKNNMHLLVDATNYMIGVEDEKYYPFIFKLTEEEYFGLINDKIMFNATREKNPLKGEFLDFDFLYY